MQVGVEHAGRFPGRDRYVRQAVIGPVDIRGCGGGGPARPGRVTRSRASARAGSDPATPGTADRPVSGMARGLWHSCWPQGPVGLRGVPGQLRPRTSPGRAAGWRARPAARRAGHRGIPLGARRAALLR